MLGGHRLQLEYLITLCRADDWRDVARLHLVDELLKLRRHVRPYERTDETAGRLGGRIGYLRGDFGEILALQQALPCIRGFLASSLVLRHVDADLRIARDLDEDFAQRDRRRIGEFVRMVFVVLMRLFLGNR